MCTLSHIRYVQIWTSVFGGLRCFVSHFVVVYEKQTKVLHFADDSLLFFGLETQLLANWAVWKKDTLETRPRTCGFALRDAIWSRTVKYNVHSSETVVQTVVLSLANRFHKFWCSKLVENERRLTQSTPNTQMLSPQRPNRQNVEPISEGT